MLRFLDIHILIAREIYGEHQGADTILFKAGEDILYSQIAEKMDLFERYWDAKAQAPYLISKSNSTLNFT